MVGTNARAESEGYDRESLTPLGRQAELVAAAIPRTVFALLAEGGVKRACLGLVSTPARLSPAVIRTRERGGLQVVQVLAGSPTDRAEISAGDILLTAGSRAVSNAESLQRLLFADAVGQPLQIRVLRRGEEMNLVAVPEEMQANGQ